MQSDDICQFIDDVLDIKKQGIAVCGAAIKDEKYKEEKEVRKQYVRLELNKVKIRTAMILILLEDRLERENIVTEEMARQIERLKKYGDVFFLKKDDELEQLSNIIINSVWDMSEWNRYRTIIDNLCADQQFCCHKCYVNSYVDVL